MGEGVTCKECTSFKQLRFHGVYDTNCLECCARLVASVSPDRLKAMGMLASIAKNREAPSRESILARVKELVGDYQASS